MTYVVAIDQGTTGSTVLFIDESMNVVAKANEEFPQIYPEPGWVEHDPDAIWQSVVTAYHQAKDSCGAKDSDIAAVGITNQRETTLIWDRKTGKTLHNAIVWQDRRTTEFCKELKAGGHESRVRELTGLVLDPYFSGTKAKWLLDKIDGHSKAAGGELCIGTVDSYLLWRLTDGKRFATDATNASRTLLCDIGNVAWSDELLELLSVPKACLPEIVSSSEVYGETAAAPFPPGVPIAGIAGDQQAALFGQACFGKGSAKCTFGTGAFILMNTGNTPVSSEHGLLTTIAWKIGDEVDYALEGSAFVAGAAVQWLRDGLQIIESAADIEELAGSVKDTGGVMLVPAFAGLGAPHWRPEARALISGLTRGSSRAHIARATLEGIAHQNADILVAMAEDAGAELTGLRVDGGASANNLLMQLQADALQTTIARPNVIETTALGAACLAGLATGVWSSRDEISKTWKVDREFSPAMPTDAHAQWRRQWASALEKA